jgi:internalin A
MPRQFSMKKARISNSQPPRVKPGAATKQVNPSANRSGARNIDARSDVMRKTERRVQEAVRTGAVELDLGYIHLTELPKSVTKLVELQSLKLRQNELTTLPESLGKLTQLRKLDLSQNRLSQLPEFLGQLTQLEELNIAENQLTALPESLGKLFRLKQLNLFENRLTVLPEFLSQLTQLETLEVSVNGVTALPEFLSQLTQLQELSVRNNRLTVLPEFLGELTQLQRLKASNNELVTLPDSLGKLTQLQELELTGNQLTALPKSLKRLTCLKKLFLQGNPALGLPAEILGLGPLNIRLILGAPAASPASILDYYFRTCQGWRPLNEAKLILVGRGGVGKTCLVKRLLHDTFDEHQLETEGIDIQPWEVQIAHGEQVRLHVWDFGGQDMLHGTHQFFLTERTLYLLVLSGREGNASQDAEYWMQLIRSFGNQSKVIIALNKSRKHPFDVNRGFLLEKYPFIADFVKTDCEEPAFGLAELRRLIFEQTDALEHRKMAFPTEWFAIKERLATMKKNFVTWEEYQNLCRKLGETDPHAQRELANFLHILGIALHYADDPRLRDMRVLKPTWVKEGVYSVLRARSRANCDGVLQPADLASALDATRYPTSKHDFLLRLMERFQLCFRLPGERERYLVPELLGEDQPDIKTLLAAPGLGFRYKYDALPEGLLPRFIVQTHAHSERNPSLRWRTGVVLARDGCNAVVRADARERRVDIHITGPEAARRGVLAIIREKFDEQHRNLKGLVVEERVPVPGEKGPNGEEITISYQHLVTLEEMGEDKFIQEGMRHPVQVTELLEGVEAAESRRRRQALRLESAIPRQQLDVTVAPQSSVMQKCKIVFLAANPVGTELLALDKEIRQIEEEIRLAQYRDSFELITKFAVRRTDLIRSLSRHRPNIFHFSGHGNTTEEILLVDDEGHPTPVSKTALGHLFAPLKDDIRLVVLNACYSRPQAEVLRQVIDCVVGMKRKIGDDAARTFAATFYGAVGNGCSVGQAFALGKGALMDQAIPEDDIPELLVRKGVNPNAIFLFELPTPATHG